MSLTTKLDLSGGWGRHSTILNGLPVTCNVEPVSATHTSLSSTNSIKPDPKTLSPTVFPCCAKFAVRRYIHHSRLPRRRPPLPVRRLQSPPRSRPPMPVRRLRRRLPQHRHCRGHSRRRSPQEIPRHSPLAQLGWWARVATSACREGSGRRAASF